MTARPLSPAPALLLALLLAPACGDTGAGDPSSVEFRTRVQVAKVGTADVQRALELTGTVQAGRSVHLLPTTPGKIEALPVKVGQAVKKGEVLARMDLGIASLQRQQAQAAVRLAELGLETAKKDFARVQELNQRGSVTAQQFEQAQAGLEMAQLQVQQAQAALGLAGEQLDGGVLRAPFDGTVSVVGGEEGDWYNPMTVSPLAGPGGLVGVVDLSTIRVDLDLAEADVGRVSAGMPATIQVQAVADQLPPDGLPGRVESVGLAADASTRTFPVRVVADNPGTVVRAGMAGRVWLELDRRDGVLAVPRAAVQRDAQGAWVLVVEQGAAHKRPVTLGLEGRDQVEVQGGLQGGEQVIVDGSFGLPDGALVEVAP
ncbi:efflux RND transporter periplasmic adaptor subunit [Myxococcota bacterium]|nr:efflux RND transporter periplasmic adaptor subunit [Myxococcota bacterium]